MKIRRHKNTKKQILELVITIEEMKPFITDKNIRKKMDEDINYWRNWLSGSTINKEITRH